MSTETGRKDAEARTFIVVCVPAALLAWDIGFDLGAFETIDHRRFWAIWVLCTVTLVASELFRETYEAVGGRWRLALLVPTLWLITGFAITDGNELILTSLTLLTIAAVPIALFILARLLAGEFFTLTRRSQAALAIASAAVFVIGLSVGANHDRYLDCEDFARVGDYVPPDCID